MNASFFAVSALAALHLSVAAAAAAPISLYDGSASPTAQGWTRFGGDGTEVVGAGTTAFNTLSAIPELMDGNYDTYTFATGANDFVVSIGLQALTSSYNSFDAAITFSPFGNAAFPTNDRLNSLTIGMDMVLWGDNVGPSVAVDTSVFHEYAFRYLDGNLDVFVDTPFDSIVAGTAVAALSRPGVVLQATKIPGVIVFGDATNDANVNSHYVVDFVNFEALEPQPVPEPVALTLVGLGVVSSAVRRRLRKRA